MKIISIILFVITLSFCFEYQIVKGQKAHKKEQSLYNPEADATADLKTALIAAKSEGKHLMIQIGGNWCPWCIKLHELYTSDELLDSLIRADYVVLLLNYSKENKNLDMLKQLGYPQRFGFPVLVVLNENGEVLHTQNTAYFEHKKDYDINKISMFLEHWNKTALDPEKYK